MIGLETHVQLDTKTKLFCSCKIPDEDEEPNTCICEVCLGLPGSKPMINEKAIEYSIKLAKALNCKINETVMFSRKTYFYPDMSKNYQITQYEIPIGENGYLELKSGKKIRIRRIHLEEDPAKIIHKESYVLVDYNRSGIPLCEIVTEPDFENEEEVKEYLRELENILYYLGIYREGSMKSDVNISIEGGERVEVKNVSGIKDVEKVIKYELIRQNMLKKRGMKIERETRGWNENRGITYSMRKKEYEEDYGYITDPDITSVDLWDVNIPELPRQRIERFIKQYNLNKEIAYSLVSDKELSEIFEELSKEFNPETISRWLANVLKKELNYRDIKFKDSKVTINDLKKLFKEIDYLSDPAIKMIIRFMVDGKTFEESKKELGLDKQVDIDSLVDKVIKSNEKAVKDYLEGNDKAINFMIGMILREHKGIDPKEIRERIIKRIKELY